MSHLSLPIASIGAAFLIGAGLVAALFVGALAVGLIQGFARYPNLIRNERAIAKARKVDQAVAARVKAGEFKTATKLAGELAADDILTQPYHRVVNASASGGEVEVRTEDGMTLRYPADSAVTVAELPAGPTHA